MDEKTVYLSLGSNLGNREENLRSAIDELAHAGVAIARVSSFCETEPVDLREQPWFLNCVVEAETQFDPFMLLRALREIETNLRAGFVETDSAIPLDVLANYLAGAQIALVQWWLEKRRPYTPENLAQSFHRLQRAAIRDAFDLRDDKKA